MATDPSCGVVQFLPKNVLQSTARGCMGEPRHGVDEFRYKPSPDPSHQNGSCVDASTLYPITEKQMNHEGSFRGRACLKELDHWGACPWDCIILLCDLTP